MASEGSIVERVERLIVEEHEFREEREGLGADGRSRIEEIDVELDQCWDLLRQRRHANPRRAPRTFTRGAPLGRRASGVGST